MKIRAAFKAPERELLGRLRELAGKVRAETDQTRRPEIGDRRSEEDGFVITPYKGPAPVVEGYHWHEMAPPRNPWREKCKPRRVDNPAPLPRPGEVPLGIWIESEMLRWSRSKNTIYGWFKDGMYPGLKVRKAGRRYVFVRVTKRPRRPLCAPLRGEMLLKHFVGQEATRCGVSVTAIYNRFERGKYPGLKSRKVNGRVVFVRRTR